MSKSNFFVKSYNKFYKFINSLLENNLNKLNLNNVRNLTKNNKIIFTFVENVVYKIDNIISKSRKKYLMKKYNKKVNYFYSEFKKIHQNQKYKNNKLFKIYAWYKSYFKK